VDGTTSLISAILLSFVAWQYRYARKTLDQLKSDSKEYVKFHQRLGYVEGYRDAIKSMDKIEPERHFEIMNGFHDRYAHYKEHLNDLHKDELSDKELDDLLKDSFIKDG
jgi:hypothetical protein